MPVLLRPWPDARMLLERATETETQSLGKLRWWALPKGDRRAVSTQECRRGGAPPPDKPGNDDSSLHVGLELSMMPPADPDFFLRFSGLGGETFADEFGESARLS